MFHRPLTLEESKALWAFIVSGTRKVLDYMFWPLYHEQRVEVEDQQEPSKTDD